MEELIFFGIIILLSVIDSIARSRKAKRAGKSAPPTPGRSPVDRGAQRRTAPPRKEAPAYQPMPTYEPMTASEPVTTYDAEPTYDAKPTYDTEPTYDAEWLEEEVVTYDDLATSGSDTAGGGLESPPSSAGMIPSDLWEEIAGLARGSAGAKEAGQAQGRPRPSRAPTRTSKTPPAGPPRAAKPAPARKEPAAPSARFPSLPVPARPAPEVHPIHLTHTQYGTDPSERTRSAQDEVPAREVVVSADVRAARAQLGGDTHALRRAIILHEVLSPPASLRAEPFED